MNGFDFEYEGLEVERYFNRNYPGFIYNPRWDFDNKYFKGTVFEAYNVYMTIYGIYIEYDKPSIYYTCENNLNNGPIRILYQCEDYKKAMKTLILYINVNEFTLNKYGEITSSIKEGWVNGIYTSLSLKLNRTKTELIKERKKLHIKTKKFNKKRKEILDSNNGLPSGKSELYNSLIKTNENNKIIVEQKLQKLNQFCHVF